MVLYGFSPSLSLISSHCEWYGRYHSTLFYSTHSIYNNHKIKTDRNTSGLLFTCLSVRTQYKRQQIGFNNLAVKLISWFSASTLFDRVGTCPSQTRLSEVSLISSWPVFRRPDCPVSTKSAPRYLFFKAFYDYGTSCRKAYPKISRTSYRDNHQESSLRQSVLYRCLYRWPYDVINGHVTVTWCFPSKIF